MYLPLVVPRLFVLAEREALIRGTGTSNGSDDDTTS